MQHKSLRAIALQAIEIINKHEEASELDAGFDAGEFSGPAHDRMCQREIQELAKANGFTIEELESEIQRIEHE